MRRPLPFATVCYIPCRHARCLFRLVADKLGQRTSRGLDVVRAIDRGDHFRQRRLGIRVGPSGEAIGYFSSGLRTVGRIAGQEFCHQIAEFLRHIESQVSQSRRVFARQRFELAAAACGCGR